MTTQYHVDALHPDPGQPRKIFVEGEIEALCEDMKRRGQLMPILVINHAGKIVIVDGHRRWIAAKRAGITHLTGIELKTPPTKAQLRIVQMSLDFHRVSLNPMERSNLLKQIQAGTGWSIAEMEKELSIKQSLMSKLLSYQKLAPSIQALLATGALEMAKAYEISQIPDHEAQIEMVKQFAHLSRDAFKAKINGKGKPDVKTKWATFALPGGYSVTFKGPEASMEEVIERLNETVKQLRRAASQGHDVVSAARVMGEKAK